MKAAVIQLSSGTDSGRNFAVAEKYLREAAHQGAELCVLPELFSHLGPQSQISRPGSGGQAQPEAGQVRQWAAELASQLHITLVAGTFMEPSPQPDKLSNTMTVFDKQGRCLDSYRKIHLFDCSVPGAFYRESDHVEPGTTTCVCHPEGTMPLGLAICYDLRFPELFRSLAGKGAQIIALAAAFTEKTGRDHWELLLRARAVENQVYLLASDQYGVQGKGLRRFGRSMIVDPWGVVIAQVSDGEGWAMANLDPAYLQKIRQDLPALENCRPFH